MGSLRRSFLNLVNYDRRSHTLTSSSASENYVKRVRVLVANRPRLMRELVLATISEQPDIEVVGEVADEHDLTEIVEQVQPDVLILAMNEPEKSLGLCGFLLGRYPQMRILALAPEQNRGIFYWAIVDIRTKALESSEAGILNAVRERPALVATVQN
jgi:DNA-binding NarL/FixJ family response regulator